MDNKYKYVRRLSGIVFVVGCLSIAFGVLMMGKYTLIKALNDTPPVVGNALVEIANEANIASGLHTGVATTASGLQWIVLSAVLDLLRCILISLDSSSSSSNKPSSSSPASQQARTPKPAILPKALDEGN